MDIIHPISIVNDSMTDDLWLWFWWITIVVHKDYSISIITISGMLPYGQPVENHLFFCRSTNYSTLCWPYKKLWFKSTFVQWTNQLSTAIFHRYLSHCQWVCIYIYTYMICIHTHNMDSEHPWAIYPLVIKHSCGKSPSLKGKFTINGHVK